MSELKDSGIAWVGVMPESWKIKRGKFTLKLLNRPLEKTDDVITCFRDGEVTLRKNRREEGFTVSLKEIGYQGIEPGDLVIHGMDGFAGAIGISDSRGKSSPVLVVCDSDENKRFIMYYLRTMAYNDVFSALATGIRVRSCDLRWNKLAELPYILPSQEEQKRIVPFLDGKSSQIDVLIANVQSQIEKLKAYKQSLITEVVTKGLDPTVPMKDSGVEWIGEIAENFQIMRLKNIAYILDQYRKPITADMRSQEGDVLYDYYGASGAIDKIDGYTIDDHVMLIGEDGANLRMRNLPLMYEVKGKAWINNHAHILKPKENVLFYYLFYALEGLDINPYITGSAQPKLSQEKLKIISVPIPAIGVQELVIEYIQDKHRRIDRLIAIKQSKIEKLEQYKKSLIYEYVTGKKEVRL